MSRFFRCDALVSLTPPSLCLPFKRLTGRRNHGELRTPRPLIHHPKKQARGIETNAMESMPPWTLDQIAGLAFGTLLVVFYFSAGVVDNYIAKVQRSQLDLCEECGGLYESETCQKKNCPFNNTFV